MSPYLLLSFVVGYFILLLIVAWYTSRNRNKIVKAVTEQYQQRINAEQQEMASDADPHHDHHMTTQARLVGLRAERVELHRLHTAGEINDETLQELMKPLDLAEESLR